MSSDVAKFSIGNKIAPACQPLYEDETVMLKSFRSHLSLMEAFGQNEIGNRYFLSLSEGNTDMLILKVYLFFSLLPSSLPPSFPHSLLSLLPSFTLLLYLLLVPTPFSTRRKIFDAFLTPL